MHINVTSSKDENNQNLNPNVNNLYDNFLENDFKLLPQNYDGKTWSNFQSNNYIGDSFVDKRK